MGCGVDKLHTVAISSQHAGPSGAVRRKDCAGYTVPGRTAPSMDEMKKLIVERVIKMNHEEIISKNGEPAITVLFDKEYDDFVNETNA